MTDLMEHGLLADPYWGTNELDVQWIEGQNWTYRTCVQNRTSASPSVLRLEGLDTYARISINDSLALETDNAHRAYTVSLPAQDPAWTIEVTFLSPVAVGQAQLDALPRLVPVSNEMKPIGQQTSSVTRKPFYQYGWDWGPRLTSAGFTGRVFIAPANQPLRSQNRIATGFNPEGDATVTCQLDGSWPEGSWMLEAPNGTPVATAHTESAQEVTFRVESPERWWPAGMGPQPLYRLTWTPREPMFSPLEWRLGLRSLEWVREEDTWGRSFACTVNGVRVQARGANIIPADYFPVRGELLELDRLQSAVDANMNMVRVWGGAVYPSDAFYDFCDSTGLLVWQDFMFACAMVPGDSAFAANVQAEAEHQVKRLHHRPSLALWCGNNESEKAWKSWGWPDAFGLHGQDSIATEQAYDQVFNALLPTAVSNHSNTTYWPSSPSSDPLARSHEDSGDEHAWRVWFDTLDFRYFSEHGGRFASEYGLQSLPDCATLAEVGVEAFEDSALQFRQRSRMEWLRPGLDGWGMMRIYAKRYAADPAITDGQHTSLERWIYLSQLTQALGLREALERHRTSEGRYAGSLYWQLSDVWPTVSWSTVDHAGRWKLAHHAVQLANKPRCVQRKRRLPGAVFTAFNDTPYPMDGTSVHFTRLNLAGDTLGRETMQLGLGAFEETDLRFDWDTADGTAIMRWHWEDASGAAIDSGDCLDVRPAQIQWPKARIEHQIIGNSVLLTTDSMAFGVRLTMEGAHFMANGFTLFPGEVRTVEFTPLGSSPAQLSTLKAEYFGEFQQTD